MKRSYKHDYVSKFSPKKFFSIYLLLFSLGIGIVQGHDLVDTNRDREVRVDVRRNQDAPTGNVLRKKANK